MWIAPSREILDTSQDKHGDKMNDFTMVLQVKLEAGNLGRGSHTSSRLVRKRGKDKSAKQAIDGLRVKAQDASHQ